jgi:hypothetical protein
VRLGTPVAIVIGFFVLAAAIVLDGQLNPTSRYSLTSSGGLLVRLDTRSGETVVCLPGRDESRQSILLVACTRKQP